MAELNSSPAKRGSKSSLKRMPVRVDLTAMVDLAFLLITFFMLTTSLSKPRSMPVVMPADGPAGPVPETRTMTICLGKNNQVLYYLGLPDKPLTTPKVTGYNGLNAAIAETSKQVLTSTGKGMIVIIKPDNHSIYANLVETLDDMNLNHVLTYAISAISPKDVDMLKVKGIF